MVILFPETEDCDVLSWAADKNYINIVKYLLNIGIKDDGFSLLYAAKNENHKMLKMLIESNIQIDNCVKELINDLNVMKQNNPIQIMLNNHLASCNEPFSVINYLGEKELSTSSTSTNISHESLNDLHDDNVEQINCTNKPSYWTTKVNRENQKQRDFNNNGVSK